MKLHLPILIFTLSFSSCQHQETAKSVRQTNRDTTLPSTIAVVVKTDETHAVAEDFSNFWKRFRTAVINADTSQMITMTRFPFKTRGPLDDDPISTYGKDKFAPVFIAFSNQWNGQDLEGTTELDYIKKKETANETDVQKKHARVGDLVFDSTDEGWKLVFAFLNNETIDSLQK